MGQDGGLCPWLWAPRAGSPEITLLAPDQQQMQAIQQKLFLSASYPALNMGYKCDLFLRVVKDVALQRGSELRFVLRRISYEQMPQKTTLEPWGWMIDETSRPKGALQCSPAPTKSVRAQGRCHGSMAVVDSLIFGWWSWGRYFAQSISEMPVISVSNMTLSWGMRTCQECQWQL